jgi:hypothetical protein
MGCENGKEDTEITERETDNALFPIDNAQWKELVIFDYELPEGVSQPAPIEISYTLRGDTVVDGIRRGKLYFSLLSEQNFELIGYIHLQADKVYFRAKEDVDLSDKYIMTCVELNNQDILLYDFTLETDAAYSDCFGNYTLSEISVVTLGEAEREQYCFSSTVTPAVKKYWIKGMGSTLHLFNPVTAPIADWYYKRLICFSQNNEVLWLSPDFSDCGISTGSFKYPVKESFIQIFPNPASYDVFYISSSLPMQKIQIFDMTGALILQMDVSGSYQNKLAKQQLLHAGIYLVNVVLQNGISEQKQLIIQ